MTGPDLHFSAIDGVDLRIARHGPTAIIAFDAPQTRNALTRATRVAFVDQLRRADADDEVRAIVVTGTDPAFSSGVNTKELLGDPDYVAPPTDPATALRSLRTPTIAAVNGMCISGGLEIAIACSFIIASDRAAFADTHARIGIAPGWGLSADLPALIGVARARRLSLTAESIDASTAASWGLATEVVDHHRLLERALDLARAIAAVVPRAAANMLALYEGRQDMILGAVRRSERDATARFVVDRERASKAVADHRAGREGVGREVEVRIRAEDGGSAAR